MAGDALDLHHGVVEAPLLAEDLHHVAGAHPVKVAEDVAVAEAADVPDEDAVPGLARPRGEDPVPHPERRHLPGGGPELRHQAGRDDRRIEPDAGHLEQGDGGLDRGAGEAHGAGHRRRGAGGDGVRVPGDGRGSPLGAGRVGRLPAVRGRCARLARLARGRPGPSGEVGDGDVALVLAPAIARATGVWPESDRARAAGEGAPSSPRAQEEPSKGTGVGWA